MPSLTRGSSKPVAVATMAAEEVKQQQNVTVCRPTSNHELSMAVTQNMAAAIKCVEMEREEIMFQRSFIYKAGVPLMREFYGKLSKRRDNNNWLLKVQEDLVDGLHALIVATMEKYDIFKGKIKVKEEEEEEDEEEQEEKVEEKLESGKGEEESETIDEEMASFNGGNSAQLQIKVKEEEEQEKKVEEKLEFGKDEEESESIDEEMASFNGGNSAAAAAKSKEQCLNGNTSEESTASAYISGHDDAMKGCTSVPGVESKYQVSFEDRVDQYKQYKAKYGREIGLDMKARDEDLYKWCLKIRNRLKYLPSEKGADKVAALKLVGFDFGDRFDKATRDAVWLEELKRWMDHRDTHKTPHVFNRKQNKVLYRWVYKQRFEHVCKELNGGKSEYLTDEREQMLKDVGFSFEGPKSNFIKNTRKRLLMKGPSAIKKKIGKPKMAELAHRNSKSKPPPTKDLSDYQCSQGDKRVPSLQKANKVAAPDNSMLEAKLTHESKDDSRSNRTANAQIPRIMIGQNPSKVTYDNEDDTLRVAQTKNEAAKSLNDLHTSKIAPSMLCDRFKKRNEASKKRKIDETVRVPIDIDSTTVGVNRYKSKVEKALQDVNFSTVAPSKLCNQFKKRFEGRRKERQVNGPM